MEHVIINIWKTTQRLIDYSYMTGTRYDYRKSMVDQAGVVFVRGCEVEGMLDASGRVIEEGPEPKPELDGDSRTFRLLLDPNQYGMDLDRASKGKEVCIHIIYLSLRCPLDILVSVVVFFEAGDKYDQIRLIFCFSRS
jgi:hypothetical protein